MANVPGVMIVGDFQIHGGPSPTVGSAVSAFGACDVVQNFPDKPMRVCPDNLITGQPSASILNWYPWFDGLRGATLFAISNTGTDATHVRITPSPGWAVNQFAPTATRTWTASVTNSTGLGFLFRTNIASNTADTLTLASSGPVATSANGCFVSDGRFSDYHALAGALASTELGSVISMRGGSTWQVLGQGVGPDAGLIRELLEHVYVSAPYFQLAKWGDPRPTTQAYEDGTGIARGPFQDVLGRINAAWTALANGNTLVWDLLVLDMSQADVVDWATNPLHFLSYQTALTQTIAWFRSAAALNNSSLKVLIANHALDINSITTPNGTLFANRVHRAVAAAGTNIRTFSLEGLPFRLPAPYVPSTNKNAYEPSAYWTDYPRIVRQSYELLLLGNPPNFDGAMPVYVLIGDSISVGPISEPFLTALNSPTMPTGPRDSRQKIYNRLNVAIEVYDANDNSNTSGTVNANAGPDCSLTAELMKLHPVTGFVLVKRGSNGSTLAANVSPYTGGGVSGGRWDKAYNEHYPELVADIRNAINIINQTLHKQADLRGVAVILGSNDQIINGGGTMFANALAPFVADLRADLSTRTSGPQLRIAWRVPQLGTSTSIAAESVIARAAVRALAAADTDFVNVEVDDLERNASDNLHETPDSSIEDGRRLAAGLAAASVE